MIWYTLIELNLVFSLMLIEANALLFYVGEYTQIPIISITITY